MCVCDRLSMCVSERQKEDKGETKSSCVRGKRGEQHPQTSAARDFITKVPKPASSSYTRMSRQTNHKRSLLCSSFLLSR